jgi:hypothetical protein
MKSHMLLLQEVLQDLGDWCCTSTIRDFQTLSERVEHEGLSFLTIALPDFGKTFEQCLDRGRVTSSDFVGYKKSGYLPKLFSGFTGLVFDPQCGLLLDDPNVDAIQAIRQVTLMFGKVNLPCSDARVEAAINKFIECEKEVRTYEQHLEHSEYEAFGKVAWMLFGDLYSRLDRQIYDGEVVPRHGPGSTADRLSGNGKYVQTEWTERLERVFFASEHIFPNWRYYLERDSTPLPITFLEPGAERPVKVITVPKTLKTPRIIAVEPTCMQYMQQAVLEAFMQEFGRDNLLTNLIGFDDQIPNQEMARLGSLTGSLATLDLSEASDRVSNQLVRKMVAPWTWLHQGLDATRSRKADVPGHGVIRLAKFASMGSALCFPVEAMVFTTLVFLGIQKDLTRPLSRKLINDEYVGRVRIYGDDIIVPVEHVRSVVATLQDFGLVVNVNKSFWTGKFRESCGKEYFNGEDVSIVRVREMLPTQRRHVREIVSTVSLRNRFYEAGMWRSARFLDDLLQRFIPMPQIYPTSPALGRHSFLGYDDTQGECTSLQKPLVKAMVVSGKSPISRLDDYPALLKWFLKRGDEPFADKDHLERAGRPKLVNIKLRKVPPY